MAANRPYTRYVSDLEARLEEYERRAETGAASTLKDAKVIGEMRSVSGFHNAKVSAVVGLGDESTTRHASWTRGEPSPAQPRFQGSPGTRITAGAITTPQHDDHIGTDAMVVVPSPENASDGPIGGSSLTAFVRSMLRTVGKDNSNWGASKLGIGNSPASRIPSHQQDIDVEALFLPPRRVADGFIEAYWAFVHPILPILHKPTFMKSYKTLWATGEELHCDADSPLDAVFLSTLNIVLAIGCQSSDQVVSGQKHIISEKLYQRSRRFFMDEFLDSPTLSVVQLLLLTGIYLQSTKYANRCWNSIGSAIRTAQSIGLHLERRSDSRVQIQREMERRVWHTCVFLDRLVLLAEVSKKEKNTNHRV